MTIEPISASPFRGIQAAAAKVEKHAEAIASGDINVDDMVGLMEGQRSFEANLAVVKTGDQMIGTLLDMFA